MPQSLSSVYLHLGSSTKNREPWLRDPELRVELHAFLRGVSKHLDCPPVIVGGVEDHVHLLARCGRGITQSDWVKELKRVSSRWIKERDGRLAGFAWQGGCRAEGPGRDFIPNLHVDERPWRSQG